MAKHSSLVIDAWIREAQEVSRLVEDIETRIRNKDLKQEYRLKDNAKSKILEVGVKLDRLESLLLNPPSNLILTIEDLEFRWKMLSDFRLRTRALAASLYPSPSIKGARGLPVANTKGIIGPDNSNDQHQMKPFFSKDDSEMLKPLITSKLFYVAYGFCYLMQSEDATQSRMQLYNPSTFPSDYVQLVVCLSSLLHDSRAAYNGYTQKSS
ncbi:conserved hypothetical protein [Ricinus communis]|uniref:Uncharacterized protein n=1 Tax=Ricinus communis TaxID=3988 RepID=B9RER8_RICCO|nr:conserved hypothetical protein [Ricinus communis]